MRRSARSPMSPMRGRPAARATTRPRPGCRPLPPGVFARRSHTPSAGSRQIAPPGCRGSWPRQDVVDRHGKGAPQHESTPRRHRGQGWHGGSFDFASPSGRGTLPSPACEEGQGGGFQAQPPSGEPQHQRHHERYDQGRPGTAAGDDPEWTGRDRSPGNQSNGRRRRHHETAHDGNRKGGDQQKSQGPDGGGINVERWRPLEAAEKSTTAVGRSGSRPPMSASMRMNRYPAGATQTIAGSKATVAWGPPAVTARAATRATTGSSTRTNAGSAKVSEGTPEKPLVPTD